jgi:hypothetical protein
MPKPASSSVVWLRSNLISLEGEMALSDCDTRCLLSDHFKGVPAKNPSPA